MFGVTVETSATLSKSQLVWNGRPRNRRHRFFRLTDLYTSTQKTASELSIGRPTLAISISCIRSSVLLTALKPDGSNMFRCKCPYNWSAFIQLHVLPTSTDDFQSVLIMNGSAGLLTTEVARWVPIRVSQVGQVFHPHLGFQFCKRHNKAPALLVLHSLMLRQIWRRMLRWVKQRGWQSGVDSGGGVKVIMTARLQVLTAVSIQLPVCCNVTACTDVSELLAAPSSGPTTDAETFLFTQMNLQVRKRWGLFCPTE